MQANTTRKSLLLLLSVTAAWICAVPASQAQYWGYSPYTGSSNWLSVARSLTYPLNLFSSRAGAPLYLASNLIYPASHAAFQRMQGQQRQLQYGQSADAQLLNYRGQRIGQQTMGSAVGDQMAHAKRYGTQQQTFSEQDEDFGDVPVPRTDGQDWSGPAPVLASTPPLVSSMPPKVVKEMPPTAPERSKAVAEPASDRSMLASVGTASASSSAKDRDIAPSEPLAEGFVHVFNDRFGGDIKKALSDKDTCKYAKAVGLVDSSKFDVAKISPEKADLIRAIFADRSESASVRLHAVRVLLKH